MKIAVSLHNGRVAPTFDWSMRMRIVDSVDKTTANALETSLDNMSPPERVRRARELGADVLICGGISNTLMALSESLGIKVVPWVAGEIDDVLKAFAQDRLTQSRFTMPGCRGRVRPGGCGRQKLRRHRRRRGRAGRDGGES